MAEVAKVAADSAGARPNEPLPKGHEFSSVFWAF